MIDGNGRRATIADVARAAGTSTALVSRVLTGNQRVAGASRARIEAAIEALRYVPSATARGLRLRRTGMVALVVPYLDNPLYSLHAMGAERELARAGLLTVVCSSRTLPTSGPYRGRTFFDVLGAGRVDGVLLFPYQEDVIAAMTLRDREVPVVLIDREPVYSDGMARLDAVVVDHEGAVADATARLVGSGYRRIGLVSLRPESLSGAPRLAGYRAALAGAGIAYDPDLVATGDGGAADGADLMATLLDSGHPPDAVVVATTMLTLGASALLRRRATRLPDDLAVIGYGHEQSLGWPEFPVYRYPGIELGAAAARVLLDRLAARDAPAGAPCRVVLPMRYDPVGA